MTGLESIIIVNLIILTGSYIHCSIGIGFAVVAAPVILNVHAAYVPGPLILGGMTLSALILIREKIVPAFTSLALYVAGKAGGACIGTLLLIAVSRTLFLFLFGALILVAVVLSALRAGVTVNGKNLFTASLASGIMGIITSAGGPPMALLYQNQKGKMIRANLAGFFLIGTFISLCTLAYAGKFGMEEIRLYLWMLPGLIAGFLISKLSLALVDRRKTRHVILAISFLSGCYSIYRGIVALVRG